MKFKKLSGIVLLSLGFTVAAHANEVLLTANHPMKITFKVAHKNQNSQPVLGELQSANVDKNMKVPISLDGYDQAGVVIVSADGHELPSTDNQFGRPKQCSMTTDKSKATGALEFTLSKHSMSCQTYGGLYG